MIVLHITYTALASYKSIIMPQGALLGYHIEKGGFGAVFVFLAVGYVIRRFIT